jgi:hypothetical protein
MSPGNYKLFAWTELAGADYQNAEFLREFEERVNLQLYKKGAQLLLDLTAI